MRAASLEDYMKVNFTAFQTHLSDTGWIYLSQGRHRKVYRRNKVVIKIPRICEWEPEGGCLANIREAKVYKSAKKDPECEIKYAPCRLLDNGCLMMLALEDLHDCWGLPKWCNFLIDGPQVGRDSHGNIFAYDYSEEYLRYD